jgi:hypothetical protein
MSDSAIGLAECISYCDTMLLGLAYVAWVGSLQCLQHPLGISNSLPQLGPTSTMFSLVTVAHEVAKLAVS